MSSAAGALMRIAAPVLAVAVALPYVMRAGVRAGLGLGVPQLVASLSEALPEDVRKHLLGTLYISVPMAMVGAIGGAMYKAYWMFYQRVEYFLTKYCQVTMIFNSVDKNYDTVVDYVGTHCAVDTGKLLASTTPRTRPSFQEMLAGWLGGKMKTPTLYFQPDIQSFASFFYWTDQEGVKHKIWISRWVEKPQLRSDSSKTRDPESISLSMWWTRDAQPLKSFLSEALKTMLREDSEGRVDIYVKHMWLPIWTKAVSKERRDRDTVILDEDLADYVLADIRHFFTKKTADWYHNAGIPYRRGYLLYGPPGCGKTSFAQVLAGELGLDVCLMNLSNHDMNDDDLAELLRAAPGRSMLLLEDVDAIFVERSAAKDKSRQGGGISFSGLLNALDGAAAQEGCIIVMTTNHKDRLDEALIRPGRCDVHVLVNKASKSQARRMFERFFSRQAQVASAESSGAIVTETAHGFSPGSAVSYRFLGRHGSFQGALKSAGRLVEDNSVFYVGRARGHAAAEEKQLALYDTREHALAGGAGGAAGLLLDLSGGKGGRLQECLEVAERFATRIPQRQVSMAKLQGYLMKQKLLAEQDLQKQALSDADATKGEEGAVSSDAVHALASESAVMNVHELLDEKVEAEESKVPVYDHLRRLGLHRFAPFFEHFGIREKEDFQSSLSKDMGYWHPDLWIDSPQRRRLVDLLEGKGHLDVPYGLADLSVLRDRFLRAFPTPPSGAARRTDDGAEPGRGGGDPLSAPAVPKNAPLLVRATSAPADASRGPEEGAARESLLRLSHRSAPVDGLKLLEMAHRFQEELEENGKTEVSMWQLEKHFERFAGDPEGALEHCSKLRRVSKDRKPEELQVPWLTTFGFLVRVGLESHAWALEDNGFAFWNDWKHLDKDALKDKGEMLDAEATLCHAVANGKSERADLLRKFQLPEFADLAVFFRTRFPSAAGDDARRFALALTDELGCASHSCLQVQRYLEGCKSPLEALRGLSEGLPPPEVAEARRVRPEKPAPPPQEEDWLDKWLKEVDLGHAADFLRAQGLQERDLILASPIDHAALKDFGMRKMGERQKLLQHIEAERSKGAS